MTFLKSLVRSSARAIVPLQIRFSGKRQTWVRFLQRRHVSSTANSVCKIKYLHGFFLFSSSVTVLLSEMYHVFLCLFVFKGNSHSSTNNLSCGVEPYEDLKRHFERRLRAAYKRFSNIPDYSSVRVALLRFVLH